MTSVFSTPPPPAGAEYESGRPSWMTGQEIIEWAYIAHCDYVHINGTCFGVFNARTYPENACWIVPDVGWYSYLASRDSVIREDDRVAVYSLTACLNEA